MCYPKTTYNEAGVAYGFSHQILKSEVLKIRKIFGAHQATFLMRGTGFEPKPSGFEVSALKSPCHTDSQRQQTCLWMNLTVQVFV